LARSVNAVYEAHFCKFSDAMYFERLFVDLQSQGKTPIVFDPVKNVVITEVLLESVDDDASA